jgi:hypothetical protein
LELLFDGNRKPYLEQQSKAVITGKVLVDRRYRIGVRNISKTTVHQVRLVLEACEPGGSDAVHLGHSFQVMGEPPGTGQFSVPPGEVPTVFVDVIYDETIGGSYMVTPLDCVIPQPYLTQFRAVHMR